MFSGAKELTVADLSTNSTWFTTADANLNSPMIDVYLMDANAAGITHPTLGDASDIIYSLDGCRVSRTGKGIYIIGGRKIVK